MNINDDDCIRYLMREMDPSEEIEFERKMLSDQNLLIEVESLRSTYNKFKKLPLQNPPAHLVAEIQKNAVQQQSKRVRKQHWLNKSVAIAATFTLLLASAGIYFYDFESDTPITNFSTASQNSLVKPWVDKNEVISVSDRVDANRAKVIGNDYEKSYEKLIPVQSVEMPSRQRQGVLLTRAVQNNQ